MEVVADTVGSIGVLIAGIVTVTTHWPYADVVVAVLVALWVLPRAIALARAALRILSESSPTHIDVEELRTGAVRGRRRHRGARPARVDAGARQGHGHRAPDQSTADSATGARRRTRGAHRARARTRDRPGRAARRRGRLQLRSDLVAVGRAGSSGREPSSARAAGSQSSSRSRQRAYSSVSPIVSAACASTATQRRKPRFGFVASTAPARIPSSRCGAAGRGRGGSRCGRRRTR